MLDLVGIKALLVENKIYVDEKEKNFICICPYCGDHKDAAKKGHLYVSKNEKIPVCHCWYCNTSVPISKLIKDITGTAREDLVTESTESKVNNYRPIKQNRIFYIPDLDVVNFPQKAQYIKKRTQDKIDLHNIPNMIFDLKKFFSINKIDPLAHMNPWELDTLHSSFVCFLSTNHTIIYCRRVDDGPFAFKKIPLQESQYGFLDYWSIKPPTSSDTSTEVVLSEGIFDVLGCYVNDSLKNMNTCKIYAAGCTFSYSELLRSVCFYESMYKADVNIISDSDKKQYSYTKFIRDYSYLRSSLKIWYNTNGKDFGVFPIFASRLI